jgi:hypothetical protein
LLVQSPQKLVQGGRLDLEVFAGPGGWQLVPRAVDGHAIGNPVKHGLAAHA